MSRREIITEYAEFLRSFDKTSPLHCIKSIALKPVLGLFYGESNSAAVRRFLAEGIIKKDDYSSKSSKHEPRNRPLNLPIYDLLLKSIEIIDPQILDKK